MKCKKVITGCSQKYNIEEITILEGHQVHYSGPIDNFRQNCDPDMIVFRDTLLRREVADKTVFNFRKLFIFLAPDSSDADTN